MDDPRLHPDGLNETQMKRLEAHAQRGQAAQPEKLFQAACEYLDEVRTAHAGNAQIDLGIAEQIVTVLGRLLTDWNTFTPSQQSWLRGAIRYFSVPQDDQPDLQRGGFRDDVEVLNACLAHVHRHDLML